MTLVLKNKVSQQFRLIVSMILRYAVILAFYFYYVGFGFPYVGYIWVASVLLVFDIIPTLALFIQYLIVNKNTVVIIDTDRRKLSFKKSSEARCYAFDEIECIHYYESLGKDSHFYSWEGFRYYSVKFTDNQTIIISCLLMNQIEMKFEFLVDKKAEKYRTIYVFIRKRFG